jgi:probable DNA metabolism protein
MCDSRAFELDLFTYIILGFKEQKQLANINHMSILNIQNLQKEYFSHTHKMYGFVRFVELEDGSLYARVETKFNILYHLAKHFSKRLNNQPFIIHDIKRELAFIHSEEFIGIREIIGFEEPVVSRDEEKFSKLWKHFFESVAIESRSNKKLQQQLVPLLYRTYMSEFGED